MDGRMRCQCKSFCQCGAPPTVPPPPKMAWVLSAASTWIWRYRPHHAWAGWHGNYYHALAGGSHVPMTMMTKFGGLPNASQGRVKVFHAELFLFFAWRNGAAKMISGYETKRNWSPWRTSWNNAPATDTVPLFNTPISGIRRNRWAVCSGGGLTKLVEDWINGKPNYGFSIRVTSESNRHLYWYSVVAGNRHPLRPRIRFWYSTWS